MTAKRPEGYTETRIISKRKAAKNDLPSLSLSTTSNNLYEGLYKGELAINDYAELTGSNPIINATGVYIRVGASEVELTGDKLVRLGPAYVTDDFAGEHVQVGTVVSYSSNLLTINNSDSNQLTINQQIYTLTADKAIEKECTISSYSVDSIVVGSVVPSGATFTNGTNVYLNNHGTATYQLINTKHILSFTGIVKLKVGTIVYSGSGGTGVVSVVNSESYEINNVTGTWPASGGVYTELAGKVDTYSNLTLVLTGINDVTNFYNGRVLYIGTASCIINKVNVSKYEVVGVTGSFTTGQTVYIKARPTVPGINDSRLVRVGQIWLRNTDKAVFINDGKVWQRVTPIEATAQLQGLVELANQQEVDLGADNSRAVTPLTLNTWMENKRIVQELDPAFCIYVDASNGDDGLSNDGSDQYRPFRTIERALLQATKISYVAGQTNDFYGNITINIGPGEYIVDNRPGSPDLVGVGEVQAGAEIINELEIGAVGTAGYNATNSTVQFTLTNNLYTKEIYNGKQIFSVNSEGKVVGKCVLVSSVPDANNNYKVRQLTGAWTGGLSVKVPQHKLYNSVEGGVIVPRGCSLIGYDLRKTKIIPQYLGDLDVWLADDQCQGTGRTSIFKLTGGCLLTSFTFTDNPGILASHHLCTTVEFASSAELSLYYTKVVKGLRLTNKPAMISGDLQAVTQENTIVANTIPSEINSVKGTSPYVFNCSVLSSYGLCGMLIDGNKALGFKSFVTAQFTNVSLQVDSRAFEATGEYKEKWRHYAFKAINKGYVQIVSCFVIANAAQYVVETGGEISITNSCSNFGDLSLVADGSASEALPQDKGGSIVAVIPPKPISSTALQVPILGFKASLMASPPTPSNVPVKIYLDGTEVLDRISPYKLLNDEEINIQGYKTKIVATGAIVGTDTIGGVSYSYINVDNSTQASNTANLAIYSNRNEIDLFPVSIQRRVDRRTQDEKLYWLKVTGLLQSNNKRKPLETFLLKFPDDIGKSIPADNPLFIAITRDKNFDGTALPNGTYYIALLRGGGTVNEIIEDIYPVTNIDSPDDNPTTSLTYLAVSQFLSNYGMTVDEKNAIMVPSSSEKAITGVGIEFLRPSLIRASGHTWEWVGYLNYSTALPKLQNKVLTFQDTLKKIKRETKGGRVFCTGMDENGNFIVGNKVFDLKTGDERNLQGDNNDSKVFKNVTVGQRLLMSPASTLDLRSMNLSINAKTGFSSDTLITSSSDTYAKETQGGFIQLASVSEVQNRAVNLDQINKHKAITPNTLVNLLRSDRNVEDTAGGVDVQDLKITSKLSSKAGATINLTSSISTFTKSTITYANAELKLQGLSATEPTKIQLDNNTEIQVVALDKSIAKYYATTAKPGLVELATTDEVLNRNISFDVNNQVDVFDNIDQYNAITPRTLQQLFRSRRDTGIGGGSPLPKGGVEIRDLKILSKIAVEPPPIDDVSTAPTVDLPKARVSLKEANVNITGTTTNPTTITINKDTQLAGVSSVDPSTFGSYATTSKVGLVELATTGEAKNKVDEYRAITAAVLAHVMDLMLPIGTILESVSTTAPTYGEWKLANGAELNSADYPEYVNAVQPKQTNGKFNLPDRKGKVSVGVSSSYPLFFDDGSHNYGGSVNVTLDVENMPKHTHTIQSDTHHHQVLNDGHSSTLTFVETNERNGGADTDASPSYVYKSARDYTTGDHTHSHNANLTGGTPSLNAKQFSIMQPYVVCNHYVRVK